MPDLQSANRARREQRKLAAVLAQYINELAERPRADDGADRDR